MLALVLVLAFALPVSAEARGPSIVRDAEIEALVADYARPLLKAAGLRPGAVRILIANDARFNAFVSGRNMIVNTGLIMQAATPNEVIGVIAHEIGHVKGGHQTRLAERVRQAKILASVGTLLGVGAGVAGGALGSRDAASAGAAVGLSAPAFAMRNFLVYKRAEEATADRTAATLLRKTKQSGRGMIDTFERFRRQLPTGGRIDPYKQSHPMPSARLSAMRDLLSRSPYYDRRDPRALQRRHDMARAKIAAYTDQRRARGVLTSRTLHPQARAYGSTILEHLYGSPKKAVPMIDRLIKQQPKNAYLHEMKGEILLRAGRAKEAVRPLRRAIKLDRTGSGFLRVQLGHALLSSGGSKNLRAAVRELKRGTSGDRYGVAGYRYLALAHAGLGQEGEALLASAELAYRSGRRGEARAFARRARSQLKKGSPAWVRAGDILG